MDEITSDLDLFAREGILNFLRCETELRGATIFYCTCSALMLHVHATANHDPQFLSIKQSQHMRSLPT